jgi:hypothetical protein
MIKELYHGTNTIFEKFNPMFLNSDCAIDQYGSGYYFYDSIAPTIRHGDYIIFANCDIKKILDVDETNNHQLNYKQISQLILKSPKLDMCLTNFGDIEYESYDKLLDTVIKLYVDMDIIHQLNILGNDFFKGKDTHILLKEFIKITGINCIRKKFTEHSIWVILDEKDIEITKVVPFSEIE